MNYLEELKQNKGIHKENCSLVVVNSNGKTWYNLYTDFDGKNNFRGETEVFEDAEKAIFRWKELTMECHEIYQECLVVNTPKLAMNIKDSWFIYQYCLNIQDIPELAQKITNSSYAVAYCQNVKDRPEVRAKINSPHDALRYCRLVEDSPEMRSKINTAETAYFYFRFMRDKKAALMDIQIWRPEMFDLISGTDWMRILINDIIEEFMDNLTKEEDKMKNLLDYLKEITLIEWLVLSAIIIILFVMLR